MTELRPNKQDMISHMEFLFRGLSEYSDGLIEISYGEDGPNRARLFGLNEIDAAAEFAMQQNLIKGSNIYVTGSLADPESEIDRRTNDGLHYAGNSAWVDIDDNIDKEELKGRYKGLPPSAYVITGTVPYRRCHLWWKLDEPNTDPETLREAVEGICQKLGGDPKTTNPMRIMRLAGSLSWPKKAGRVLELTTWGIINNNQTTLDRLADIYPVERFTYSPLWETLKRAKGQASSAGQVVSGLDSRLIDGRDEKMSKIVYVSILNLAGKAGAWPTAEEVFEDAWPTYVNGVASRDPLGLEAEGRGTKLMLSKIKSKLRMFSKGYMHGFRDIESVIERWAKISAKPDPFANLDAMQFDPETGELIEEAPAPAAAEPTATNVLPFKWAADVAPNTDANDFIEGLLEDGKFSVIYGESGSGKTFFATDLAFHVAQGKRWRGRRVEQGAVIYVALEGNTGLNNRIAAYKQENGEEAATMPFAMIGVQINFIDRTDQSRIPIFLETVKVIARAAGRVRLVVIDTLARAMAGGDENSVQDMGLLIETADKLTEITGAHVCFVHHTGKDRAKGARGHSSLKAALDTEIEISKPEDEADKTRTAEVTKQRDLEFMDKMRFSLKRVVLGANQYGEDKTSCIVQAEEGDDFVQRKSSGVIAPNTKTVLDAFYNAMAKSAVRRAMRFGDVDTVTYENLATELEELGWPEFEGLEKIKPRVKTHLASLRSQNLVASNRHYLWSIKK